MTLTNEILKPRILYRIDLVGTTMDQFLHCNFAHPVADKH